MMRTPAFWSRPPGWQSALLSPLALIWKFGAKRRQRNGHPTKVGCPVICVGNLTAGGTGKSPTVILLIEMLRAQGWSPVVLSRGHGGTQTGPHLVTSTDLAADVGDEPVMLAALAPVIVARDRVAGARAALEAGADVIVMDDGFQDPSLHKDLSLLVVDGALGFGNGRLLPAGPLREPVADGLARADLALVIGTGPDRRAELSPLPICTGTITPLATGMPWNGLRVIAFAGIGQPEKFFTTLRELGAKVMGTHAFADHEPYGQAVLDRMRAEAKAAKAQLVTTEKDAARLPRDFLRHVLPVPVRLTLEDGAALEAALTNLKG